MLTLNIYEYMQFTLFTLRDASMVRCSVKKAQGQFCDSSVGIALGYGLDDRGSRVRFPAGSGNFSLHHRIQPGSGAHTVSYSVGSRGSFHGGKSAEA
jgi:hypothetical protein